MVERDIRGSIEQLGDVDEVLRALERFSADARFCNEHFCSFMEQYPNQWIAILDQRIVATSKSQKSLISKLKKAGINPSFCYMQFMDPNPSPQILFEVRRGNPRLFLYFYLLSSSSFVRSLLKPAFSRKP